MNNGDFVDPDISNEEFARRLDAHMKKCSEGDIAALELQKNVDTLFNDDYRIEFLGGRPNRNIVINNDDITNLIIALNSSKSIDHFISVV